MSSGILLADWESDFVAEREDLREIKSSGVRFARKIDAQRRIVGATQKDRMRSRVQDWFAYKSFPVDATIVTMPGYYWNFENGILKIRMRASLRTHLVCLERDEAIFRASMQNLPGIKYGLRHKECPNWATGCVQTHSVNYYRCAFEDFAYGKSNPVTGAWLDFCGPLTSRRMDALSEFWNRLKPFRVILTCMNGRQDRAAYDEMMSVGGFERWIESRWIDSRVIDCVRYQEGAAMIQLAVDRFDGTWRNPSETSVDFPRPDPGKCPDIIKGSDVIW